MVTIILDKFVAMIETLQHVQTLIVLFSHGDTTLKFCS